MEEEQQPRNKPAGVDTTLISCMLVFQMQLRGFAMGRLGLTTGLLASLVTSLSAHAAGCPGSVSATPIIVDGAAAFITKGLQVDADGAPNSYLVDGNGLSYTCDGVVAVVNGKKITPTNSPRTWFPLCKSAWADAVRSNDYSHVSIFGFLAGAHNVPIVQKAGDPLPGKGFVSTTSMPLPGSSPTQQVHWVDATKIPYYVLPGSSVAGRAVAYGDVAAVYVPATGRMAFAVFADRGPARGEASVKLHIDLGHNPIVKGGGVDRAKAGLGGRVLTVVFPGAGTKASTDAVAWNHQIQEVGEAALQRWGGLDRLKACAK